MQESTSTDCSQYKEEFRKYIYPEIKDLGKQFVTLVSAILTFSIFFAKDFIDTDTTAIALRLWFGLSLIFLILSITFVGTGLWFNYVAFCRTFDKEKQMTKKSRNCIENLFKYGGISFVIGLGILSTTSFLRFIYR